MTYQEQIVQLLLKKYEASVLSKQGSALAIEVSVPFDRTHLPEYVCSTSYLYRSAIEAATRELESLSFLEITWNHATIIKVTLKIDQVEQLYHYIGCVSPKTIRAQQLDVLAPFLSRTDFIGAYCTMLQARILEYRSTKSYYKDTEELQEILRVLCAIASNETDIKRKKFSNLVFGDSKQFDKVEKKYRRIIEEHSAILIEEEDDFWEYFHIYKNPTFLYLKGNGVFQINEQIIDLTKLKVPLSLSKEATALLNIVSLQVRKVITVENLAVFEEVQGQDCLFIYLAGFHNEQKRRLLQKIYAHIPDISYYHLGDIDAGGYYILNHLIVKTQIPFSPLCMDIATLEAYRACWIPLTKRDEERIQKLYELTNLRNYQDVFTYMLKHHAKLEQESIIWKSSLFD